MTLSRYEIIGIAGSIALMALSLWLVRIDQTNALLQQNSTPANQTAAVASAESGDRSSALAQALDDARLNSGELEKLVIDDVKIGTGPEVVSGDMVTVHYVGSLTNGTRFDNSYLRGTPFTFEVGAGRVIEGWDQGLVGMQVGGQRVLVIPAPLAYGDAGGGPIPPNSTLVFTIELLAIE